MAPGMASEASLHEAPAPGAARSEISGDIADILAGLERSPRTLPTRLFYDDAGCILFGRITQLPEYYVTRAEMALLDAHAGAIVDGIEPDSVLVEYGASDEAKADRLLRAAGRHLSAYVPIDIAGPGLAALQGRMRHSHPDLDVRPVRADFTAPVQLPPLGSGRPRLGFFPGSTIGNFEPDMVVRFLRQARADLSQGTVAARFVIGTDLRKDPALLIPAYDDAAGVTAAFNRNILLHVNRIAHAAFDPMLFSHRAVWNDAESRIEMHLVSRISQVVEVAGRSIRLAAGESLHTESSYKHTREGFLALAGQAGWAPDGFWTDADGRFGMHRLIAR